MKMNWGTGIIISFLIFISATAFMVATSMNQDIDLVSENYYEKTLVYQDQIDKLERSGKINLNISRQGRNVAINFPQEFYDKKIIGEVNFYRPSDAARDFKLPLELNKNEQWIDGAGLEAGLWRIQISWTADMNDYYYEQTILIN